MIDVPRDSQKLAIAKMQEIVDQAVEGSADAVTIEFAKEGGLEVLFVFGNTSVGDILVDKALETAVITLIHERAGLEDDPCGVMHWESHGQNLEIIVEEYDSFGETAYALTFPKGRRWDTEQAS
jgi:hypothetical protein